MRILALDLATKTGYAMNEPDVSGTEDFSLRRGDSPGIRYLRFVSWLEEIIAKSRPDIVVAEQAHHRGGAATEVAAGFQTHMQSTCAKHGVEFTTRHTGTIKKHATGKGNAGKDEMMAAFVQKWGREPKDDNHADAMWLLDMVSREFNGQENSGGEQP